MFPKIEDWNTFKKQVRCICQLIIKACKGLNNSNIHLISVDEKPGIQVLERKEIPMKLGKPCRRDIEYARKGTTCLIAGSEVGSGKIISYTFAQRNNESEFLRFIKQTVSKINSEDRIIFLLDNFSTHSTVSLTEYIAAQIGFNKPLGKNRRHGILKSKQSRRKFLTQTRHRIYFQFTPKHCSWINPIENWFSVLQRRVLNNGNFSSIQDLQKKTKAYIKYHNSILYKPLNWQFTGFTKENPIAV